MTMRILLCVLVWMVSFPAMGSSKLAFVELAGSGGLGSVNLAVPVASSDQLMVRGGFSVVPIDVNTGWVLIAPVMVELQGQKPLRPVVGAGLGLSVTTRGAPHIRGLLEAGLRWHPNKPVWVGVAYTPMVSFLLDRQVQHWGGLQIGTTWGNR